LPLFASDLGSGVNVIYDQEDAEVMQLANDMNLAFSMQNVEEDEDDDEVIDRSLHSVCHGQYRTKWDR
jgi:hypothetical protein